MRPDQADRERVRLMKFEHCFNEWRSKRMSQEEAAQVLGVDVRTFRRHIDRYEEDGLEGLRDRRWSQPSNRKAPVDEVMALVDSYEGIRRRTGAPWNAKHYYDTVYVPGGGKRHYNWVRTTLQSERVIVPLRTRGTHRRRREPMPMPGMMIHQDGSWHNWFGEGKCSLIVTMDDATNEHYSMFFCPKEGTASSFRGIRETIDGRGLFSQFYSDRASQYHITPKAGGKPSKKTLTQVGRALGQLSIRMIPAGSPQARGRGERPFGTHQDRLVKELALEGITDMEAANEYIQTVYLPHYNKLFMKPPRSEGSAFVPLADPAMLDDVLCKHHERSVRNDNCVEFENLILQIPADRHRHHSVKAKVKVLHHSDGSLSVMHGPRRLARYDAKGTLVQQNRDAAA